MGVRNRVPFILARMCDAGQTEQEAREEFALLYASHGRKPGTPLRQRWPWMSYGDETKMRDHWNLPPALALPALRPRRQPEPELAPGDFVTRAEFTELKGKVETLTKGVEAILGHNLSLPYGHNQ